MFLVISLRKGDTVSVRTGDNSGAIFGGHYTSFSGFFCYPLIGDTVPPETGRKLIDIYIHGV